MDFVYLVKNNPENHSEELRYSLRSLKNIPHDKVVIVGEKPDWVKNVVYIPVVQDKTKYENVRKNLIAAINSDTVSDDFVLMNDDFFISRPLTKLPNLHFGPMAEVIRLYKRRYPEGSEYIRSMEVFYEFLRHQGYRDPLSYELHVPMQFNKTRVKDLLKTLPKNQLGPLRSYYGNYFQVGGQPVADVKVFIEPRHNHPDYHANPQAYLEKQTFLSATSGSFKRGLVGEFIKSKFSEKSEYEV